MRLGVPGRVTCLALGVLVAACGGSGTASSGGLRPRVRVGIQPYLSAGPLHIAEAEGYFTEQGLDVEFIPVGQAEGVFAAILSGEIDVWPDIFRPGQLRAAAQGARMRIVADRGHLAPDACSYVGFVLRKGISPAEAPVQVRRVSGSRDGPVSYVMSRMLAARGITWDSLEFVQLPGQVFAQAIQAGSVDGVGAAEPWLLQAGQVGTFLMGAEEVLPDYQWGVLTFGPRLLTEEREAGVRFMVAFRRGVARFNEGKTPRNLEILSRATGQTPAALTAACWPRMRVDGRINLSSLLDYQRWAIDRGVLDMEATPDQLWDSSFVVAADSVWPPPKVERK